MLFVVRRIQILPLSLDMDTRTPIVSIYSSTYPVRYVNFLPQSLTKVILNATNPDVVISGDQHDVCHKTREGGIEDVLLNTRLFCSRSFSHIVLLIGLVRFQHVQLDARESLSRY